MSRVVYNAYQSFLYGIRRSKTSSVTPEYWTDLMNRVINALLDPMDDFLSQGQRIDDLEGTYIITLDNTPYAPIKRIAQGTDFDLFPLPVYNHNVLSDINSVSTTYPVYKRLMTVKVRKKIVTTVGRTGKTSITYSDWIDCKPLKSDYQYRVENNEYLKSSEDTRLNYRIEEGGHLHNNAKVIKIYGSDAEQLMLRYIRTPRSLWFDKLNYDDNEDNTNYVEGQGCVPPDMGQEYIDKVVDIAIEEYMKRLLTIKK